MPREYRLSPFKKAINVMLRRMFTRGKGPPDGYVVTTRGRKTGREYNTPVRIVENASGRYVVSPYGERNWTKNARTAGSIGLTRGNRTENVRIRELSPEESGPILKEYVKQVKVTQSYFDVDPDASVEAFVAEAPRHPVFRVEGPAS